jgi:hypothetical protein
MRMRTPKVKSPAVWQSKPLTDLNQLFVGSPGTGKATVGKLYGRIWADLGYLSRGDGEITAFHDLSEQS